MKELDDKIHNEIKTLCSAGDELAEKKEYPKAIETYWKAWDLLPEPKTEWNAATWILTAIGDANFLNGDFKAGKDNLASAMHCPDAIGNPFIHLRLGQCQYELGNEDKAADELTRALMGGDEDIFLGDDPKYIKFLKTKIKPPVGGWKRTEPLEEVDWIVDDSQEAKKTWWKIF